MNNNQNLKKTKTVWALGSYGDVAKILPPMSSHLIRATNVNAKDHVLDVACGPGNTAITAKKIGAEVVVGLDLTPELLERANQEATIAEVKGIKWEEGNVENLPFEDNSFDVVLSSVGHMFAPNQEVVTKELLRVTKPHGRISFTTWPPEHAVGRIFAAISKQIPRDSNYPPSPMNWGIPEIIKKYFENKINDIHFERGIINVPILSSNHYWYEMSTRYGPVINAIKSLDDGNKENLRRNFIKAIDPFISDNILKLDYLLTMIITKEKN